jgi:hypothetical protein
MLLHIGICGAVETAYLLLRRDAGPNRRGEGGVGVARGRRTRAGAAKSETAFSHEEIVMWRGVEEGWSLPARWYRHR